MSCSPRICMEKRQVEATKIRPKTKRPSVSLIILPVSFGNQ